MPPVFSKTNNDCEKKKVFYWRGKKVTERKYLNMKKKSEWGKHIRDNYGIRRLQEQIPKPNQESERPSPSICKVEGRRIVNLKVITENSFCKHCKEPLRIADIENDTKYGLASIFNVKCSKCHTITEVPSDSQHQDKSTKKMRFDTNTKAVAGILHSGAGNGHLNKFLAALNMPAMNWKTFKLHEKEVGQYLENMAIESCKTATLEEKRLT
ncbi:hypothetical protein PV326_000579, partial [Microctonus aethiopoides]